MYKNGHFGGIKPQTTLEFECFRPRALGGANSTQLNSPRLPLSAKAVSRPTNEFHTARSTLYLADEKMEIEKMVPVVRV